MNDKVKLICTQCGWQTEISEGEAYDYMYSGEGCPICHLLGTMKIDIEEYEQSKQAQTNKIDAKIMQEQIFTRGNDATWYIIEELKNAKIRIEFRKSFFAAGGKMPEKELPI